MIELPEGLTLATQLERSVVGKTVSGVLPPNKEHKFCWFHGEAAAYDAKLKGSRVLCAHAFGIYVELVFDNGRMLCFNDGVNVRLIKADAAPKTYQLILLFTDGDALVFTVAMYGGIILHDGEYDNTYYLTSKSALSPFDPAFPAHYRGVLAQSKPTLSAKAFLATEQRFPGVGNGTAQDILFAARLHPKRKLQTFREGDGERLLSCMVAILGDMTQKGGRDTEKDLFGTPGGYATMMSKRALAAGCPACGGPITKESYLGGSVYYCPRCQPLEG